MGKKGLHVSTKRNENIYRHGNTFYGEDESGTKSQISTRHYEHVKANKDAIRDLVSKNTRGNLDDLSALDLGKLQRVFKHPT